MIDYSGPLKAAKTKHPPLPIPDEHQCTGQTKRRINKNSRSLVSQMDNSAETQHVDEDGSARRVLQKHNRISPSCRTVTRVGVYAFGEECEGLFLTHLPGNCLPFWRTTPSLLCAMLTIESRPVFRKGHAYQTSDTINPQLAHYSWLRPQGHRAGLPINTPFPFFPFSCPCIPSSSHDGWWRRDSRINPFCWGEMGVVGTSSHCCALESMQPMGGFISCMFPN